MRPEAFYEAALSALRFVEARTPTGRRFGVDADARWRTFRGHLTAANRIELLLRDADGQYPGAFGARIPFALEGLSEDDGFGAGTAGLRPERAEELWREILARPAPVDLDAALAGIAAAWELKLFAVDVGVVQPATKLVAAGPSAIAALARAFAGRRELSFAEQVTCVATPPSHRQLAVLVAPLLDAARTVQVVAGRELRVAGPVDRVVVSPDAATEDLQAARQVQPVA